MRWRFSRGIRWQSWQIWSRLSAPGEPLIGPDTYADATIMTHSSTPPVGANDSCKNYFGFWGKLTLAPPAATKLRNSGNASFQQCDNGGKSASSKLAGSGKWFSTANARARL